MITDFKTVGLCLEKIPQNNMRSNWKPNHHKMRDLMTTAMVANEQKMKKSQERQNRMIDIRIYRGYNVGNAPNISERMHVGNKTPVLGSMDLVTGTFFSHWLVCSFFGVINVDLVFHYIKICFVRVIPIIII